jgi:hypothetical protein
MIERMRWPLLLLVPLATTAAAAPAEACDLAAPVAHRLDPAEQAVDHQPPVMGQRIGVNITRGRGKAAGCGGGDTSCDDVARVELTPEASDDRTPASGIGYRITLVHGPLPEGLTLPTGDVEGGAGGAIVLAWTEHPDGDPPLLGFTLGLSAVDAAGNASAVNDVDVRDGEDDFFDCALARPGRRSALPALALVALASLRLRRRRRG